jgi:excisionase family DNA binding protein
MDLLERRSSMSELLTIQEMAERLKVPVSWLYARTRQTGPGTIPRIKVGKYLRFRIDEVMEWLLKQNEGE